MPKIEELSIQVLCHATEDLKKVFKAVENVLGPESLNKISISTEKLEGHYGDPVTLVRAFLLDQEASEKVFSRILLSLPPTDREELWSERSQKGKHGGKLYIRLDKQAAFLGYIKSSDKDPIKIVVRVRGNIDALRKRIEAKLTNLGEDIMGDQ
ncbi:MAG: hypothetical protein N3F65_02235 [Nitrososphaeria archaeon]|nr:hypothetical protein [Nitrososphaeria archaeon]MDW8021344.1 RNA-binding domain-containing protein [Nitrososphaerota archaeon]